MSKSKLKLIQENLLLKAKILLKGGTLEQFKEIDPEIENQFLKQVLAFEEADLIKMYKILNISLDDYPPEDTLPDDILEQKLEELEKIMAKHNIYLELSKKMPKRLIYKYLVEEELESEIEVVPGMTTHIDGCDGWCPDCFQADYCETKDQIWTKEEFERERKKAKNK